MLTRIANPCQPLITFIKVGPQLKIMAEVVSVSVPNRQEELLEWVDNKVEEGVFRGRSHAFCYAVMKLQERGVEEIPV